MAKAVEALLPETMRTRTPRLWSRRGLKRLAVLPAICLLHTAFKAGFPGDLGVSPGLETFKQATCPSNTAKAEKFFLSIPNAENALAASRAYASHPNLAGSPDDFDQAKAVLNLFQTHLGVRPPSDPPIFPAGSAASRQATLGLTSARAPSAWIDVYYPVLNTPLDRAVQVLDEIGAVAESLDLREDGDPLDPDAAKFRDAVPPFHGYSYHGTAEGQLVYANYGTQADYDDVEAAGTNMTGKIVICRYGKIFRGLKVKGAQERGAVGILIYSDPYDDGPVTVENGHLPYPSGPARNPTSVQRGSVQAISIYPGDASTPGYPAYENATRVEGWNRPRIPSLPISWANAEKLLARIGQGVRGRPVIGESSSETIRMINHVNNKVTPIWNAMAAVPGYIRDEVVVIGCHRDAWVIGAADPGSGYVSLHETVRGFGALMKHGWKPLRTVVFASWDGEEPGLVGSTEWGEDFPEWISQHVVAYLNVDITASGSRWTAAASPSLAHLIQNTAIDVPHPTSPGKTLWDARQDQGPYADAGDARAENEMSDNIHALGSGSDFTVMLQRLGIASVDQGFKRTRSDAAYHYHSVYDTQRWQELYADPGFHRHVAVARNLGLLGLRLASSLILPINTTHYALELDGYLDKVTDIADSMPIAFNSTMLRDSIGELQIASAALDAEKRKAEKKLRRILRKLHHRRCRRLRRVLRRIGAAVGFDVFHDTELAYDEFSRIDPDSVWEYLVEAKPPHRLPRRIRKLIKAVKRVRKANKKLTAFERGFISEGGIKDREWYKHLAVAPGKWLGYGATTFPGLTEALEVDKNATAAKIESYRLVNLIDKLTATIRP